MDYHSDAFAHIVQMNTNKLVRGILRGSKARKWSEESVPMFAGETVSNRSGNNYKFQSNSLNFINNKIQ